MNTNTGATKIYTGVTDLPIEEIAQDNLRVMTYIEGLSDFIRSCATPMTIALQGDWGTGKTSFMNLVIDQLGKENTATVQNQITYDQVETIVFNTWKYSQFNQEQNLSVSFLSYIVSKLYGKTIGEILEDTTDKTTGEIKESKFSGIVKMFGQLANNATTTLVPQVLSAMITGVVPGVETAEFTVNNGEAAPNRLSPFQRISYVDSAVAIEELKKAFVEAVEHKIKTSDCERIVIFIDDLDRLDPVVAVNLLEVIKIFLDVEQCVFVLSVDYSIVTKGVKLKNRDFDMDDEKAHNFFDKMIQVPFRIPMEFYNFEEFLKVNLPGITHFGDLHNLIRQSIGHNPRGVKRLINSYHLISKIMFRKDDENHEKQKGHLIALLCMQLSHEPLYRYFCLENNVLDMLTTTTEERLEELLNEANIVYSTSNTRKHLLFLNALRSYLFVNKSAGHIQANNEEDQEIIELFSTTLAYANITSESAAEDIEEIIHVPLNDIQNYLSADYGVIGLQCEKYELKSKTASGLAFEMYENVLKSKPEYIEKLRDYKNLPLMKAAGIDKRLILPYLKQLSEQTETRQWIEQNMPDYLFKPGEYSNTLSERQLPGVGYAIITNYAALAAIQNLRLILTYLEDDSVEKTTVKLKKRKKK